MIFIYYRKLWKTNPYRDYTFNNISPLIISESINNFKKILTKHISISQNKEIFNKLKNSETKLYLKIVKGIPVGYVLTNPIIEDIINSEYIIRNTPHNYNYTNEIFRTLPKYITGFIPDYTRKSLSDFLYNQANKELDEKPKILKENKFPYKGTFNALGFEDYDISYAKNKLILTKNNISLHLNVLGISNEIIYITPTLFINKKKIIDSIVDLKSKQYLLDIQKSFNHYDNFKNIIINNLDISLDEKNYKKDNWFPKLQIKNKSINTLVFILLLLLD